MTATEIEHVYTINSDETVRLHAYVRLQWLLQKTPNMNSLYSNSNA